MKKEEKHSFRKGQVVVVTLVGAGFDLIRIGRSLRRPDGRYFFHDNTALAYREDHLRPLTNREKGL